MKESKNSVFKSQDSLDISQVKDDGSLLLEIRKAVLALSKKDYGVDRPTKTMILSMNDKLIQLSKLHEHKLATIEDKINKFSQVGNHNAGQNHTDFRDIIDSAVSRVQDYTHSLFLERLGKSPSVSSFDSDDVEKLSKDIHNIKSTLQAQESRLSHEQKTNEERMNQFLNMLSLLQDAHSRLASTYEGNRQEPSGNVAQADFQSKTSMVDAVREVISAYIPFNLEGRLHDIQSRLVTGSKFSSGSQSGAVLALWQQDIMARHAAMSQSLDSIQHTLSKVVQRLEPQDTASTYAIKNCHTKEEVPNQSISAYDIKCWMNEIKTIVKQSSSSAAMIELRGEVRGLRKEVESLNNGQTSKDASKVEGKNDSIFNLMKRPLITRSNSSLRE
jgi:flagellar motility protein MotE (MotC chaperone)